MAQSWPWGSQIAAKKIKLAFHNISHPGLICVITSYYSVWNKIMGNINFLNIHLIVILAPQNKKSQSILAQDGKHPGKALEF